MERRRRFTLGGVMALIAVISLVMALILQTRRAADWKARYQAEIANHRAQLTAEGLQLQLVPKPANLTDNQ